MGDIERLSDEINQIGGVQYSVTHGSYLRVVFERHAPSDAVQSVEKITGCSGQLGATQEHLACIDYAKSELDAGTDQDGDSDG